MQLLYPTVMFRRVGFFAIFPRVGTFSKGQPLWNQSIRQLTSTSGLGESNPESGYSEEEFSGAREWASTFKPDTLPTNIAQTRFDRSSGKGGQHVNTTSSKATSTWPIKSIAPYVPSMMVRELRASRYYSKNSDSLVIASQDGRVQRENEHDCHQKLYAHIRDIAKRIIPGETTEAAKARQAKLMKAENAARLRMKKQHSDKKQSRNNRGPDY